MVFQSFIRFAKFNSSSSSKSEFKQHFFKSSYPYLSKHHAARFSLKNYNKDHYESKWWFKRQRNTSNRSGSFLSISDGHYGLYYSMYNHDAERRRQQRDYEKYIRHIILKHLETRDRLMSLKQQDNYHHYLHFANYYFTGEHRHHHKNHHHNYRRHNRRKYHRGCPAHGFHFKLLLIGFTAKFLISKAYLDNQINIENIKKFSSRLFASLSFKPSYYFLGSTAAGATVAAGTTAVAEAHLTPITQPSTFVGLGSSSQTSPSTLQPAAHIFSTVLAARAFSTSTKKPKQQSTNVPEVAVEEPAAQKVDTFEVDFLATQVSNITSAFDNHKCPEDLNIIYPLYQAVKRNDLTLPSIDLYNIVLKSILQRSLNNTELELSAIEERLTTLLTVYQDILSIGLKPNKETYNLIVNALLDGSLQCLELPTDNSLQYAEIFPKSQEFAQICIELFNSISNQLDLKVLLPKLIKLLSNYPQLVTGKVIQPFISIIQESQLESKESCLLVLELSKYFDQFAVLNNKEAFKIIESAYHQYKQFPDIDPFSAYEKVIVSLINNNFAKRAGQLLDEILMDYKESLQFRNRPTKKQVGDLIAAFIESYVIKSNDLNKGYELLMKFNSVAYLPELPVTFYNFMIIELAKKNMVEEMWQLYNRIVVRSDFQTTPSMTFVKEHGMSCRDLLLSLSIDSGDHERTFQLLKEILVKEHLIADLGSLQKTFHYLYNAVVANQMDEDEYFNQYYFGLLWQLMESQALHYQTSTDINDFISRFVPFLTVNAPVELQADLRAQVAVTSYNVNLLLSSPFVLRAVETFDVQTDNVYGLTVVMAHLMRLNETFGVQLDLYKRVAEFESILIEKFEDPDNFYVELTPEMTDFVNMLKHDRDSRVSKIANVTEEISTECESDLSGLLQLSFEKGISRFVDAYAQGSKFTFKTWNSVVNYEFLESYISQFDLQEFLQRMWMTKCTDEEKIGLLNRLLEYKMGNIVHEVGIFIKDNKIYDEKLLVNLFDTCLLLDDQSINDYFLQEGVFKDIYSLNNQESWIASYLEYLMGIKKFHEVSNVIDSLDGEISSKLGLMLLEADLEFDLEKFKFDRKRLLLEPSTKLAELDFRYELKKGDSAIDELSRKYSKFGENGSIRVQELLSFVQFLKAAKGDSVEPYQYDNFKSINLLATSLLSCRDLNEMHKVATSAKEFNAQELFGEMILVMTRSVDYVEPDVNQLMNKFFATIKLCKYLRIGSVSSENFLNIIRFLSKIKSDLLVVILNRFIMNGEFADVVNFYFMEVQVFDFSEKLEILKELYYGMKHSNNYVNVAMIDDFCNTNGIKF